MIPAVQEDKIVVFTGAGVSAESGLATFRDSDGLWHSHRVEDVATPRAWQADPELVLAFYNERKRLALAAEPNRAHRAIASLERRFEVVVITQNVDDLHERAGSSQVIHLHGRLRTARSSADPRLVYDFGDKPIAIGDRCEKGSQLRPDIVWFGEAIQNYEVSRGHLATASRVLVVGTSLAVFPAAGLLAGARHRAEKLVVSLELARPARGFRWLRGKATVLVPAIVEQWLEGRSAV